MKKLICLVPLALAACGGSAPEDRFPGYNETVVEKAPVTLRQSPPSADIVRPYSTTSADLRQAADQAFGYSGPA